MFISNTKNAKSNQFLDSNQTLVLLFVAWSKYENSSETKVRRRKKVTDSNLETNKLFERRPADEEFTELLQDDSEYRHKVQRPYRFETLCRGDPSCPKGCDACCKLPYHNKTGDKKGFENGCNKNMLCLRSS